MSLWLLLLLLLLQLRRRRRLLLLLRLRTVLPLRPTAPPAPHLIGLGPLLLRAFLCLGPKPHSWGLGSSIRVVSEALQRLYQSSIICNQGTMRVLRVLY